MLRGVLLALLLVTPLGARVDVQLLEVALVRQGGDEASWTTDNSSGGGAERTVRSATFADDPTQVRLTVDERRSDLALAIEGLNALPTGVTAEFILRLRLAVSGRVYQSLIYHLPSGSVSAEELALEDQTRELPLVTEWPEGTTQSADEGSPWTWSRAVEAASGQYTFAENLAQPHVFELRARLTLTGGLSNQKFLLQTLVSGADEVEELLRWQSRQTPVAGWEVSPILGIFRRLSDSADWIYRPGRGWSYMVSVDGGVALYHPNSDTWTVLPNVAHPQYGVTLTSHQAAVWAAAPY